MFASTPRVYPLLGFVVGYVIVMAFNPARHALRDGLRCVMRFPRIWVAFALFGLAYAIFQFATFTQVDSTADLDLTQIASIPSWHWPKVAEIWTEVPLPTVESVAGIFDCAITTYPLSVIAAVMMILNWHGIHAVLWTSLRKRYPIGGAVVYLVLLVTAVAAIAKQALFWWLPHAKNLFSNAHVLQISASVDAVAFIFEYLFGVLIQVYLITVCLAWIKGLSFNEEALRRFAIRRFAYVLKWAGFLICVSTICVRIPLLLAYFMNLPGVLDYLPVQRIFMSALILAFASVQVSLALHNEKLSEAIRAHFYFLRRHIGQFAWFVLICALHFFFLMAWDAIARTAIADRVIALAIWKLAFISARALISAWLLASWVCLFRQAERARPEQELLIPY